MIERLVGSVSPENKSFPVSHAPSPMGTGVAPFPVTWEAEVLNVMARLKTQAGKVGWLLLWLLGVPIPVLLFLYLLRGCT